MADGGIIRKLFVLLGVKGGEDSAKKLERLQKQTTKLKGAWRDLVTDLAKATTAITAAAGAALYQATATAREAEAIDRRSRALQLSRREYQRHLRVFEQFGGDGSDVADVLGTITDRAQDALDGMQSYIEDFGLVGIAVDDLRGKKPAELLDLFADSVAGAEDQNKALTATVRILGDDLGAKLMPMLQLGSDGMSAMGDEAEQLGAVMSSNALDASLSLQRSWRSLGLVVKGLRNELGVALAPIVEDVVNSIRDWAVANNGLIRSGLTTWAERLRGPVMAIRDVFVAVDTFIRRIIGYDNFLKGLLAAGGLAGVLLIGRRVWAVLSALSGAWKAATVAAASFGVALNPIAVAIGLIVAVLGGLYLLVDDFYVTMQGGDSLMLRFIERWEDAEGVIGGVARLLRLSMRNARSFFTIMSHWRRLDVVERLATGMGRMSRFVDRTRAAFNAMLDHPMLGPLIRALGYIYGGGIQQDVLSGAGTVLGTVRDVFRDDLWNRLEGGSRQLEGIATQLSYQNDLPPIGAQMAADRQSSTTTITDNRSSTTIDNRPQITLNGNTPENHQLARELVQASAQQRGGVR